MKPPAEPAVVPRLWPGGTVACLATGSSLTKADVDLVSRYADGVIAVNDAYKVAPHATILYACDPKWWEWHKGVPSFHGLKYALRPTAQKWPGVRVLKDSGEAGLELRPHAIRNGKNSGYQAINIAYHTGATRIILLGYDMCGGHFFGRHPDHTKPKFEVCLPLFATLVKPLAEHGVDVVNCSRKTAITCFRRERLEDVLARAA